MLESLPYSGIKQDGSLTVFYFNRDKYNFPKDVSDNIQLGKYRSIPVIQLLDQKNIQNQINIRGIKRSVQTTSTS